MTDKRKTGKKKKGKRKDVNLKRLSLHCSPRFDLAGTLDQIADSGLDLEFLSITSCCSIRIDPFPREPLIRISSNMPNLRSMCCRYLARDDDDMIALAEIFPELEVLDLSCCSINMSEEGVENALTRFRGYGLTDIDVCALLRGCPKLRSVELGDIRLDMINFPLFMDVLYEAKNLKYLEINRVTMVDKEYCDDGEVSVAQIKKAFVSAL
ncbi:hypothetical protein QQ045_032734 [Rhodiola kirilowii]